MKLLSTAALVTLTLLSVRAHAAPPVFSAATGSANGGANATRIVGSLQDTDALGVPQRRLLDFDGDLKADVAVLDPTAKTVTVGIGDGLGGFASFNVLQLAPSVTPTDLAVGNISGSAAPDLVVAAGSEIQIYEYASPFAAGTAVSAPAGVTLNRVTVADFNGDGIPDIIAGGTASDGNFGTIAHVVVFLGNGTTVASPVDYVIQGPERSISAVAVADMNGDGINDIIFTDDSNQSFVVLHGDGQGGVVLDASLKVLSERHDTNGFSPLALAVGDVDGDGHLDVVMYGVSNDASFNLTQGTVQLWRGDGLAATNFSSSSTVLFTLGTPVVLAKNFPPSDLAIADFDADGAQDIAVADPATGKIAVFSGDFTASFPAFTEFAVGSVPFTAGNGPRGVTVADLDGDGYPDLVSTNHDSTNQLSVLLNAATATPPTPLPSPDFTDFVPATAKTGYLFGATKPTVAGVNIVLHVQYSATPDVAGSWKDLADRAGVMTYNTKTKRYEFITTQIPFGTLHFRVVASDPAHAYGDGISSNSHAITFASQPDLAIGTVADEKLIKTTGFEGAAKFGDLDKETKKVNLELTQTQIFGIKLTNAGGADDVIRINAPGASAGFRVQYFLGADGYGLGTEVTSAVTGTSGFVEGIIKGGSRFLYLKVRVPATATPKTFQNYVITARSTLATSASDAVQATIYVVAPSKKFLFVTNTDDSDPPIAGSLRAALNFVQTHADYVVKFELPAANGPVESCCKRNSPR